MKKLKFYGRAFLVGIAIPFVMVGYMLCQRWEELYEISFKNKEMFPDDSR